VAELDGARLRRTLLEVVNDFSRQSGNKMQSGSIIAETSKRLGIPAQNRDLQEAIMTYFNDLYHSGQIGFGTSGQGGQLNPEFCFVTPRGRETLKHLSRDPHNPDGYLEYLLSQAAISPIAESYVKEALQTYEAHCYKATAVMIGAAAERLVLDLGDAIKQRLTQLTKPANKKLEDRSVKKVFDEIRLVISGGMDRQLNAQRDPELVKLKEAFEYYWPSIAHEIRAARNEAGHPSSIDPVEPENVDGALRIFPLHARIVRQLIGFVGKATF